MKRPLSAMLSLAAAGLMAVSAWQMIAEMTLDQDFFFACALILGMAALFGVSLSLKAVRDFAVRHPRLLYALGGVLILGCFGWMALVITAPQPPSNFGLYGGSVLFVLGVLVAALPYVARATPGVSNCTDVSP